MARPRENPIVIPSAEKATTDIPAGMAVEIIEHFQSYEFTDCEGNALENCFPFFADGRAGRLRRRHTCSNNTSSQRNNASDSGAKALAGRTTL